MSVMSLSRGRNAFPLVPHSLVLGFDTATEVALLGISVAHGSAGLPLRSILVFPALFTAGMSLVDTTDGVLMVRAYGWAFVRPIRKLYYNLTMTLISIVVAVLVGGIETLGLFGNRFGYEGRFWTIVDQASANFGVLGYLIVAIFVAGWLLSVLVYRLRGFDEAGDTENSPVTVMDSRAISTR